MPTMRRERNLAVTLITADRDYKLQSVAHVTPARPRVGLPALVTDQDPAWRQHAACADSLLDFLPHALNMQMIESCKKVCATCPVKGECLQMALEADDRFSICGGYTPKERLALKR